MMTYYTFDGVPLQEPGKPTGTINILANATRLASGKIGVQADPNGDFMYSITCLGTWADIMAITAKIGVKGNLVSDEGTFTTCYLKDGIDWKKTDATGMYLYTLKFGQETRDDT